MKYTLTGQDAARIAYALQKAIAGCRSGNANKERYQETLQKMRKQERDLKNH